MKIKILIPVYNDWQSVFKLIEEIDQLQISDEFQISILCQFLEVYGFIRK